MNDEQLTAEVKALEQRLTDVWGWGDLGRIGWNMNILFLDRDTGNRDQVDAGHEMDTELETLLATSYGSAIAEIDRVLPTLPQGPVLTALLERLQRRLRSIGEHSFSYYLEREFQPGPEHFDNQTGDRPQAEVEREFETHQQLMRAAWQCVEGSLSEYIGRVADHVAAATAGGDIATAGSHERIEWKGSAAKLAYLFQSLHAKGWIDLPSHNGQPNWTALARVLHSTFDIHTPDGNEVKLSSLTAACKVSGDNAETRDGSVYFRIKSRQ
jgi:hypothetical protein